VASDDQTVTAAQRLGHMRSWLAPARAAHEQRVTGLNSPNARSSTLIGANGRGLFFNIPCVAAIARLIEVARFGTQ
jgi:hypothetical protein